MDSMRMTTAFTCQLQQWTQLASDNTAHVLMIGPQHAIIYEQTLHTLDNLSCCLHRSTRFTANQLPNQQLPDRDIQPVGATVVFMQVVLGLALV